MSNYLIIFLSIVVLYISYRLFGRAAGTLSPLKLNTISYVFYVQIVLLTFVGSVMAACNVLDFHYLIMLVSDKAKINGWLWVMYSMIVMPCAMIALNALCGLNTRKKFFEYIAKPVEIRQGPVLSFVILFLFTLISSLVLAYTIFKSADVPFFTLLKGDMTEAAVQRVEVRRNFGGIEYIRNLLGYLMMPVFAYYAGIIALEKRRLIYWLFFILLTLMASLLLVFDIQKAPIVFFIIGFLILFTLIRGGVTRKKFILYFFLSIFTIALGYSLTTGKDLWGQIFNYNSALWGRVFISEYAGFLLSLQYFPDIITQPTWQIGIPTFVLNYFDLPTDESARLLMMKVNPDGVAEGHANLISSYYMAEAWANYGLTGLIVSPIVVGVVVQLLHVFLLKSRKEPLIIAFYSYMTVRWLLSSGFVNFLYLKIILFPLILYLFFKLLMNTLANKRIQES